MHRWSPPVLWRLVLDRYSISVSTHSLLHCSMGEYDISRYIRLRVSANAQYDLAAIMINSNRLGDWNTWPPALTECDYKWGRHRRTDCRCDVTAARWSRHQRHPAAQHAELRGASITDKPGKRMPACQRNRLAVEIDCVTKGRFRGGACVVGVA